MTTENQDIQKFKSELKKSKSIVITTHANPDGDAIGSALALFHILNQLEHKVQVVLPDAWPGFLEATPSIRKVMIADRSPKPAERKFAEADLIFCVDFNSPGRVNALAEPLTKSKAFKIMIDHHPQPADFCDLVFTNTKASSTAEMIFEIAEAAGFSKYINKNVATCLYTGIMTDTGNFRFSSTSSRTHRIIASLIDSGADNTQIYDNIYDSNSESRLRLLGFCLSEKLKVFEEFSTALISLSKEELQRHNFKKGDTEGVVNYALSIKGIRFAAFMRETDENIRISFRSKGRFDVNKFSRANFGGGGHMNAAGGSSDVSMDETVMKFISLLPKYRSDLQKK